MDGRQTEDEQRLVDLGVGPGATIRLLFRLRGGLSGLTREGKGYGEERPTPGSASSTFQPPGRSGELIAQRQSGWPQQAVPQEREDGRLPKRGVGRTPRLEQVTGAGPSAASPPGTSTGTALLPGADPQQLTPPCNSAPQGGVPLATWRRIVKATTRHRAGSLGLTHEP